MENSEKANNTAVTDQVKKFIGDRELYKEGEVKNELIIRIGEAQEIKYDKAVHIKGVITAPVNFYNKRKGEHNVLKSHVLYDKVKGTITLIVDEQNGDSGYQIDGALIVNPDIAYFGMTQEGKPTKKYAVKELMERLKFLRVHFVDKELNARIVASLMSFKLKVDSTIEHTDNQRGNSKQLVENKLSHEMQESFTLNMPIFKGLPAVSFKVDILCEIRDGGISLWHESKELMELQKQALENVINTQLETFKDIVCIEQ